MVTQTGLPRCARNDGEAVIARNEAISVLALRKDIATLHPQ